MIARLIARLPDQPIHRHLLVDEGEFIIDLVRHHPIAYAGADTAFITAFGMAVVALFGPIQLGWFFFILAMVLAVVGTYLGARQRRDVFVVTNMRVFRASGVFNVRIATMPISRILDITVDKPLLGRLLGYGHFVFESAAQDQGLRDIRFIGDPDRRDLTIQRVIQRAGLRPAQRNLSGDSY
jgi:hypothetical protein